MKEFLRYFFGKGDVIEFHHFSLAHFLPILVGIAIIGLIYKYRHKLAELKWESTLRMGMAFALIICEMSYYWRLAAMPSLGANAQEHLPITVCGWAIIFSSFMLLNKNQTLFDISYFFVFSGTIFALISPVVIAYTGPTRFRYYQFWGEHLFGYIAIFYMIFVHKMRPNFKSVIKSYIAMAILTVIATWANNLLGSPANYLFMAEPEPTASILDYLPKNYFLRMLLMGSVVTLLFGLSYLPWFLKDRKAKKAIENN